MIKKCTLDDVLRYVYDEIDEAERTTIAAALTDDEQLYDFYQTALRMKADLDAATCEPSDRVSDRIMDYARKTSFHPVE